MMGNSLNPLLVRAPDGAVSAVGCPLGGHPRSDERGLHGRLGRGDLLHRGGLHVGAHGTVGTGQIPKKAGKMRAKWDFIDFLMGSYWILSLF